MVKVRLRKMPRLGSNSYNAATCAYSFIRTFPLEILNKEDIAWFKEKSDVFIIGDVAVVKEKTKTAVEKVKEKIVKPKKIIKEEDKKVKEYLGKKRIYTRKELNELGFFELREIGNKVGTKGRSSKELIREILEIQNSDK